MSKTHQPLAGGMRRNILQLSSGAVISQILMLASTPLLTRIFNTEAFGVMAVFTAAYAIAIPITTLKYDAAVILPKATKSAIFLAALVVFIASAIVIVVSGLLGVATRMSLLPDGYDVNLCLPLALWLGALYTLAQQWSARQSDYKNFARSQVIGTVLNIGISLTLGILFGGQPHHLVMGFICGLIGSLIYMFLSRDQKIQYKFSINVKGLLRRANVYRQFPLLVLPGALLMTIGQNSIPLILSTYYPLGDVGQFAIANRLLLVPTALIGGALAESFRSEFVRQQRERFDTTSLFKKTLNTLVILALPIFSLLFVVAPFLFSVIFSHDYEEAGHLSRALMIGVAAQFIALPFACVFVALRQNALGLRVHIAATFIPLALLWGAAAFQLPIMIALGIYSAATAVCMAMMLVIAQRLCHTSDGMIKMKSSR
jgi:O-antigen/teichoic acid export membrane protein